MAEKQRVTAWTVFKTAGKIVLGASLVIQSILFLMILAIFGTIFAGIAGSSDGPDVQVRDGVALVLNPKGILSEIAPDDDPFADGLNAVFGGGPGEVSVHDLVRTVRAAEKDDRIDAMVLDLGGLFVPSIYASKAYYLADAIEDFRESGKRVIAIGDGYTQEQYLLASEADTVLMHDYGQVFILGYGSYRQYYKSALDKLRVNNHVFRVGTFKSALEPYLRDDMSEAAELANAAFLDVLWERYGGFVEANRDLPDGAIDDYGTRMPELLAAADGDFARLAKEAGLVDRLMSRADQLAFVRDIVGPGEEDESFAQVGYKTYKLSVPTPRNDKKKPDIAIVTAAGAIVDGDQSVGAAGGDYIAGQLRDAREDDDVKAVVLRVDSPGGSAFASEVMRDEVLKLKAAGKPVVVSMGSLAASGGYWISAPADRIYAAPTTVTGSIGIFGYLPTFEDMMAELGVYTDGVGTTPLAAITAAGIGPLPEEAERLFQLSIEQGYDRFLTIVADGRNMTKRQVDQVAQGRVWIGRTASGIGLVDALGDIDDAVVAAAELADLDAYDVIGITKPKSALEQFLEGMTGTARAFGLTGAPEEDALFAGGAANPLRSLSEQVMGEARFLASFNDPNATYARCVGCEPR